jgi:ankyrin repeat protein
MWQVHVQNDNGDCALINACANGNEKSARMLLGAGARVDTCCALNNETALMAACRYGHLRVVRTLIALGAQVNAVDVRGNTALMHVCRYEQDDDDEMLRLLLQVRVPCSSEPIATSPHQQPITTSRGPRSLSFSCASRVHPLFPSETNTRRVCSRADGRFSTRDCRERRDCAAHCG